MNAPTDTEHDGGGPDGGGPAPTGPRVTRDEVKDLARLRRSRTDRKVAGVAAGVARHLDIDPLLVRIAFVILALFGGGGLILYAAAWVVVPEEDTEETVVHVEEGVRTAILVIAAALSVAAMVGDSVGGMDVPWPALVAALVLLLILGGKKAVGAGQPPHPGPLPAQSSSSTYPGYRPGPPPPPRPVDRRRRGPILFPFTLALAALGVGVVGTLHLAGVDVALSAYPATVLGVVGLMLLVGAFYGRAGGLILIGLVAAAATAVTSVTNGLDMGEIHQSPATAAELAASYDLDVGDIVIDLTELDPAELAVLPASLSVTMGIGHIRIVVPDDGLRVEAEASVDLGEVIVFGDKSDTADRGRHGSDDEPVLQIDADVAVGQIEILTEREAA